MKKIYFSLTLIALIPLFFACASSGSKKGTLDLIDIDEELKIGEAISNEVNKRYKVIEDKEVTDYFQNIGRKIADNSDWTGLDYHFFVINISDILSFSLPGGYVYISRGFVERADNLSEVASILAHEIGHVVSRHGTERLVKIYGYAVSAQAIFGENPTIYQDIVDHLFDVDGILGYSEKQELRATELAAKYAWKAGFDPIGLISILEKIQTLEITNMDVVAQYQLTHPRIKKRIQTASKTILDLASKSDLISDSEEFQNIKKKIKDF